MDVQESGMFYGVKSPLTGESFKSSPEDMYSNASGLWGIFPSKEDRKAKKELQKRRAAMSAEQRRVQSVSTEDDVVKPLGMRELSVDSIIAPKVKTVKVPSVKKELAYAKKVMGSKGFLDDILGTAMVGAGTAAEVAAQQEEARKQAGIVDTGGGETVDVNKKKKTDNTIWWIIGGGLVAVVAVLVIVANQTKTKK